MLFTPVQVFEQTYRPQGHPQIPDKNKKPLPTSKKPLLYIYILYIEVYARPQ